MPRHPPFQKGNKHAVGASTGNEGKTGRPANASKLALRELLLMADVGGRSMRDKAIDNLDKAMDERSKGKMTRVAFQATETVLKYTDPQTQHVVLEERQPGNIPPEEAKLADDVVRATLAARKPK